MVIIIARGPFSMRDLNVLDMPVAAEATPILIFILSCMKFWKYTLGAIKYEN